MRKLDGIRKTINNYRQDMDATASRINLGWEQLIEIKKELEELEKQEKRKVDFYLKPHITVQRYYGLYFSRFRPWVINQELNFFQIKRDLVRVIERINDVEDKLKYIEEEYAHADV